MFWHFGKWDYFAFGQIRLDNLQLQQRDGYLILAETLELGVNR